MKNFLEKENQRLRKELNELRQERDEIKLKLLWATDSGAAATKTLKLVGIECTDLNLALIYRARRGDSSSFKLLLNQVKDESKIRYLI